MDHSSFLTQKSPFEGVNYGGVYGFIQTNRPGKEDTVEEIPWQVQMTVGVHLHDIHSVIEYLAIGTTYEKRLPLVQAHYKDLIEEIRELTDKVSEDLQGFCFVVSVFTVDAGWTSPDDIGTQNLHEISKINMHFPMRHSLNQIYSELSESDRSMLLGVIHPDYQRGERNAYVFRLLADIIEEHEVAYTEEVAKLPYIGNILIFEVRNFHFQLQVLLKSLSGSSQVSINHVTSALDAFLG